MLRISLQKISHEHLAIFSWRKLTKGPLLKSRKFKFLVKISPFYKISWAYLHHDIGKPRSKFHVNGTLFDRVVDFSLLVWAAKIYCIETSDPTSDPKFRYQLLIFPNL